MLKYNYYGTDFIDSNPIVFKKGKKKKNYFLAYVRIL